MIGYLVSSCPFQANSISEYYSLMSKQVFLFCFFQSKRWSLSISKIQKFPFFEIVLPSLLILNQTLFLGYLFC